MRVRFRLASAVAVAAAVCFHPSAVSAQTPPGSEQDRPRATSAQAWGHTLRVTVDVAEDFTKFVPTTLPGQAAPTRGSFFVTEGRVFPAGSIEGDGATFNPNGGGAIGTWLCRGTHLVDASEIPAADVWVATTQNYLFPDERLSVATEGREGAHPIVRTVVGGTGQLKYYVGEQHQRFLGFNATGGVNLRVTFVLRRADH